METALLEIFSAHNFGACTNVSCNSYCKEVIIHLLMNKDAEQRDYDNMFGKRNNQNRGKKQENVHVRQSPFQQGMASFTLDKILFI